MQKATARNLKVRKAIPDKLFYKIGEVSKIAGVEPYVLRYWESEFPFLKPRKSKSGQRIYVKKDLELILQIRDMLYNERFTIEGVRKRLGEGAAVRKPLDSDKVISADNPIEHVKSRLREILNSIK
jgi:DNA-binding transcriptional MerR regulator